MCSIQLPTELACLTRILRYSGLHTEHPILTHWKEPTERKNEATHRETRHRITTQQVSVEEPVTQWDRLSVQVHAAFTALYGAVAEELLGRKVLAAIVLSTAEDTEGHVVALGTGNDSSRLTRAHAHSHEHNKRAFPPDHIQHTPLAHTQHRKTTHTRERREEEMKFLLSLRNHKLQSIQEMMADGRHT